MFSTRGRKHKNAEQDKVLVSFITRHKSIALGQTTKQNKKLTQSLWQELAEELNHYGPPYKDVLGWKKTWADWKLFLKKKVARQQEGFVCTHTQMEESLINACELTNDSTTTFEEKSKDCETQEKRHKQFSLMNLEDPLRAMCDLDDNQVIKTEHSIDDDDEMTESKEDDVITRESTPTMSTLDYRLSEISASVSSMQSSLEELCRLMTEQNRELRRHHFVMEKSIQRKTPKRSKMKGD